MATKPIQKQEFASKEERLAALKIKRASINKSLGIKGITLASDLTPYERCPSDIPELDEATGGFLIHGGFVCVWGGKGSSKTTLALKTAARAQREGKIVAWLAGENYDIERMKWAGINLEELQLIQVPQAEMFLDIIIDFARNKLVDVIILDSIHSISPKAEQEDKKGIKSTADYSMGLLARKLSQFFPMAIDPIKRAKIAVLLIGQTRMNIGYIAFEHLSGGNALLHNCRLILKLSRGAQDDAPKKITWELTGEKDEEGNLLLGKDKLPKKKKVEETIGFAANYRFDAVQVSHCKPERTVISVPYYFESGYDLPKFIQEENAEIEKSMSGNNVEEESEQFNGSKSSETEIKTEENTNKSENISEPVRKRGRPKKEKK